jgi:hypothetical protein
LSWDIFVQDLPPVESVDDIPPDFTPRPLNLSRALLISTIESLVPGADTSDPSWLRLIGPSYDIEVSLGDRETVESFSFHCSGELAPGVVTAVISELGLRALDPSAPAGIFQAAAAQDSYQRWRQYRDQVARSAES